MNTDETPADVIDECAFPRMEQMDRYGMLAIQGEPGMTLRDYFAAKALVGIIGCFKDHEGCTTTATRAAKAWDYADAMLKAREQ